ncbi:MAG: M10 family metallopeptidase C-terminal domain-containing protein, partial [Polaromonas sp.]
AVGADQHPTPFSATNSDFSGVSLASGTVGATAITNRSVTWASEDASSAVFNVAFDYVSNPSLGTTTHATGTLTFDKVADTYALALTAPIQSFTVLTTGTAQGFTGYHLGLTTEDQTQPDVSVAKLANDFFVQFSGYSEPGGGTGANNLRAGVGGDTNTFVAGELFNQENSWVSVSGTAAGVAGDTIQKGEVLDLDFFTSNPFGNTGATPDAQAAGIFLKFDGINSEDLVVVLKLIDANGSPATRTTKAFVVDNSDILRKGDAIPAGYNISLDNNDGAVIFESNDFNAAGQNYVIEGAQVLVSTEGIAGSGINLNSATGADGGSSGTQAFGASTTDNDVIKISDMGFLTTVTPNTNLSFSAAVVDADGDVTATQTLDVTIVAGANFAAGADREAIQGRAGVADIFVFDTVADSPAGANHDVITGFVSGTDKIDVSGIDANSVGGGANDVYTYIDTAAFGNVAGQLRFDAVSHMLQGDVNGDGAADLAVELVGVTSVAGADLFL